MTSVHGSVNQDPVATSAQGTGSRLFLEIDIIKPHKILINTPHLSTYHEHK